MKTAVSIPDDVFRDADQTASERGWSRSQLYTYALREFLARTGDDPVTRTLDELADELSDSPAPGPGRALIDTGAWEW